MTIRAVEPIVVVGVVVADVGAGSQLSTLVNAERFGATDSPAANNGRPHVGTVSDARCEVMVLG